MQCKSRHAFYMVTFFKRRLINIKYIIIYDILTFVSIFDFYRVQSVQSVQSVYRVYRVFIIKNLEQIDIHPTFEICQGEYPVTPLNSFTPSRLKKFKKIGITDSEGYIKFTPKYIIVGGDGWVSEIQLNLIVLCF